MKSPPNSKPPRWDPHAHVKRPRRKLVDRAYEKECARREKEAGPYWYSDPKQETNGWRYQNPSPLHVAEDEFVGHPVTDRTVICKEIYEEADFELYVLPVIKTLRVAPLNRGLQVEGMAVTFKSREDAAKFRLFYEGDTATR